MTWEPKFLYILNINYSPSANQKLNWTKIYKDYFLQWRIIYYHNWMASKVFYIVFKSSHSSVYIILLHVSYSFTKCKQRELSELSIASSLHQESSLIPFELTKKWGLRYSQWGMLDFLTEKTRRNLFQIEITQKLGFYTIYSTNKKRKWWSTPFTTKLRKRRQFSLQTLKMNWQIHRKW